MLTWKSGALPCGIYIGKGAGRIRSSKRKAINASDYRHGGKTKIVETAAKKALFGSGYNGNTF